MVTGTVRRYVALLVLLLSGGLLGGSVEPAERAGPVKIGALTQSWGPTPEVAGLRDGLLALGYREGEQFVIGVRFTQGAAILPAAVQGLIQDGADILFPTDSNAAKAAQMATNRIPIVFAAVSDPVELGLVQSFARPGGNITGVTDLDLELGPKRLELFREIIPRLKRVLFLYNPSDAYAVAAAGVYRDAARRLGIVLVERTVRTEEEARASLAKVRRAEVDGILAPSSLSLNIPGLVLEATARGIPTMFNGAFFVERGGLASYASDHYESGRQAARLVDKILKGEDPGRIPVEANEKIELAINMKVAKVLTLRLAPAVLQRVNRVIE